MKAMMTSDYVVLSAPPENVATTLRSIPMG